MIRPSAVLRTGCLLSMFAVLHACDGNSVVARDVAPLVVKPDPEALTCVPNTTATIALAISGGDGESAVTFSAQTGGVTVTGNGKTATVGCGANPGASAVNFVVKSGGLTFGGSVPVTIASAAAAPPAPVETPLTATPTAQALACTAGQTLTLGLTIAGGAGAPAVTFAAHSSAVAVSTSGTSATIVCGDAPATSTIDYTVTSGSQTVTGSVPVTISANVVPLAATPSVASISCLTGATVPLSLAVSGGSATPSVTFAAKNAKVVVSTSGGSASVQCVDVGASAVTYTVTSGDETFSGSVPVTIASAVQAIVVTPSSLTIVPGGKGQLKATVTLAPGAPSATSTAVRWKSADTTIATVDTAGVVKAAASAAGKMTAITATSVADTALRATASITVGPVSSLVQSIQVSPSALVLSVGGSQLLTTVVTLAPDAPSYASTGYLYIPSDTSIVTVSESGLVTGKRAGTAVITVAALAAPTVTQKVGVTVTAAPVRLTIQSLQVFNASGSLVPADPTNVSGSLVVGVNVDPGAYVADSLIATLGTQRVVCQRFSAQLAQALRAALTTGSADFAPITCQVPTAAFDATTGIPLAPNGTHTLGATLFYHTGSGRIAQSTGIETAVTLNNAAGLFVQVSNTPSAAQLANGAPANGQSTGPQGVLWRAGSLTVSVLPVYYGARPAAGTPINITLVDNVAGTIASATASIPSQPGAATAVFAGGSGPYAATPVGTLTGYSSPNAGQSSGGTRVAVTAAGTSNMVSAAGVSLGSAGGPVVYIDNAAPEARAQFVATSYLLNGTGTIGFLSTTFDPSASVSQAAAATALADNNGVDRVSRSFYWANTSAGLTSAQIVAANQVAALSNGTFTVPVNTTWGQYTMATNLADALGNAVAMPVLAGSATGGTFTFGVSSANPIMTVGGTPNNTQFGATSSGTLFVTAMVSSPVGFGANALLVSITRTTPSGTFCAQSSDVTSGTVTGATAVAAGPCAAVGANSVGINVTTAAAGLYTIVVQAQDASGNVSPSVTRTYLLDRTLPSVNAAAPLASPISGGQATTFTAQGTDNQSVVSQLALVEYPTANGGVVPAIPELLLRYDGATLGTWYAAPFTTAANLAVTSTTFVRAVAMQPASSSNTYTAVANQTFVTTGGAAVGATDAGANTSYATISGGTLQAALSATQPAPTLFGGSGLQSVGLTFTPNNTSTATATLSQPVNLYGGASGSSPSAVTITLQQNGVANTPFLSPFTRIELYVRGALPGTSPYTSTSAYRLAGSLGGASVQISAGSSTITNSFTVTPGVGWITSFPASGTTALDLLVVATDANGYAIGFVVPTITLNP